MQAKFSPSDAAISIFGFIKANPQFTYRYMAISAVVGLVSVFALASTGYLEFMTRFAEITRGGGQPSESEMLAALSLLKLPQLAIFMVVATIASMTLLGMALRKTVKNQEIGFYGLTWGKDENQLTIAMLQLSLLMFAASLGISIISVLLALAVPMLAIIMPVGVVLMMVFLMGRYGMYGVYTILNQKASLKQTAEATKEQFWSFFGAYFLAWAICAIALMVIQALMGLALRPLMGEVGASGLPSDLKGMLSIGAILYFALNGAISGVAQLAFVCVGAFAYHKMNEAVPKTSATTTN